VGAPSYGQCCRTYKTYHRKDKTMKAFLEHFGAIVGAITIFIFMMSVCHEYGYFWSVGSQFQTFLSTTDYFTNGVLWLPISVLFGFQWVDWWRLREEGQPKLNWKKWSSWVLGLVVFLGLGVTAVIVTWPLQFFAWVNIMFVIMILWSRRWRKFLPTTEIDEPFKEIIRQSIRLGPPLAIAMFLLGSVDAEKDLTRSEEPYEFRFKNEDSAQVRILLRNFDKGVLLRNESDHSVEFRKWDDIVVVEKRIADKSGPFICWLFHLTGCENKSL
jgi:hypothetical protein